MKNLAYVTLGFSLTLAACTEPIPVTITELGSNVPPLPSGFVAVDVSDTGHIVGNYRQLQGARAAVFLETGEAVLLPIPEGYNSCEAVAVANDGRIAGYCNLGPFGYQPRPFFAESASAPFQFIPLGEGNHSPRDMNNNGVVLGSTTGAPSGNSHWTYDTFSGEHTVLHELPNIPMFAVAINDAGDVVGLTVETPADAPLLLDRAVKWSKGTLAPAILPSPPGNVVSVGGINNRGHIVGDGAGPALFWRSATALPEILPTPVAPAGTIALRTRALAVSDDGFIVGLANFQPISTGQGKTLGIVWTPDRRIIELGENVFPEAINASEVIVGRQDTKPVRIELGLTAP